MPHSTEDLEIAQDLVNIEITNPMPDPFTDDEMRAEYAADFEAMARVIDSDDRLTAAFVEVRTMRNRVESVEAMYAAVRVEVESIKREASYWRKRAGKSAQCQDCLTALERPF